MAKSDAMRRLITRAIARAGYQLEPIPTIDGVAKARPDLPRGFVDCYRRCAPFSATSPERMYATWQAVHHVVSRRVDGDIVECGVWRGGNSMLMALALQQAGDDRRVVHLYDTFNGMTEPTAEDTDVAGQWAAIQDPDHPLACYASLDDVRTNMATTGYSRIRYVQGPVEQTLPDAELGAIAVLRLDTDWYASTLHELEQLWPLLASGGVLLIDDYGHWKGARQAVDEFFSGRDDIPLLARTDYTGRLAIKA